MNTPAFAVQTRLARNCLLLIWLSVASTVQAQGTSAEVDFAKQIVPLLTKAGCNSGACHGAAAGRGYLALSLFGARPKQDYETLLFGVPGRYVDTQYPISSLLVQKPGGYLEHTGGVRLDPDSNAFRLLAAWIDQGASQGPLAELQELSLFPRKTFECRVGSPIQLTAMAKWNDGDIRAVTRWLVIEGAQPAGTEGAAVYSEQVDTDDGSVALQLTPNFPGYWPVTVRFGATVKTVQLWVRSRDAEPIATQVEQAESHAIDDFVAFSNRRVGNTVAEDCEPHLLARRLWVDLLGRHPRLAEWQQATDDIRSGKLAELVDRLLESERFSHRAAGEIVGWVKSASQSRRQASQLSSVISAALRKSDDLQWLAQQMLLVKDSPNELNAFHQFADDPRGRAELVASVWMGVRVGCAQCHDHPLDHWTQDDYFSMAACWAEIEPAGNGARRIAERTTTDLRTGRAAVARLPMESLAYTDVDQPADVALVAWLCSDGNPQFAANIVNRVWYWLLGVGLVEEVDDHRLTNPAINPELLEHLCKTLVDSGYSLRSLVREIVLSGAYQRASSVETQRLFQRLGGVRGLKPISISLEQLVSDALDLRPARDGATSSQASTMMMVESDEGCTRGQVCSDPLGESLELAAGTALNALVSEAVSRASDARQSPTELLEDFYQRIFGTAADERERSRWSNLLRASELAADDQAIVEDLLWSWVISNDFRLLK